MKSYCEICKQEVRGSNALHLRQAMGVHKRFFHGIKGATSRERYYIYKKGMTLEQARSVIAARSRTPAETTAENVIPKLAHPVPETVE